jgi:hypothetical protein
MVAPPLVSTGLAFSDVSAEAAVMKTNAIKKMRIFKSRDGFIIAS